MTAKEPNEPTEGEQDIANTVERRIARRKEWKRTGERSFARNLSIIGSYGWTIVTPILGGLLLGRWLDRRFATGVFWTFALLVVGVALGGHTIWKRMNGDERR